MGSLFLILFVLFIFYSYKSPIYGFSLLILLFLVTPPTIGLPINFYNVGIVFTLPRLFFLGYIFTFILRRINNKSKIEIFRSSDDTVLILYIFYSFISLFWGLNLDFDIKIFFSELYILAFLGYFIAANIIKQVKQFSVLLKYIYISIVVLAIYGFIEIFAHTTLSNLPFIRTLAGYNIDDSDFIAKTIGDRGGFSRVSGTFWNNIIYGVALTLFYPFFIRLRSFLKDPIFKFSFYFSTIGGILTISRTAWFSMIYAVGLNFKRNKALFVIVLIVLFALLLPFLKSDFEKTGYVDTSGISFESRIVALTPVFSDLSIKEMFFGLGVGSYLYSNINKISTTKVLRLPGDNTFAQRVFTNGVIGVIIYILFFYNYYRNITKKTKNLGPIYMGITQATLQMILIQLTLFFVSNSLFQDPRLSFVFFSVLGAVKGVVYNKNLIFN